MKKFISQEDMRTANILEMLSVIKNEGPMTRREIQSRMGLSWGGVSQIAQRLLDLGYVQGSKESVITSAGRKPFALRVNTSDNFVIGIDINMGGLYISAVNLIGEIVYSFKSNADVSGKDKFISGIFELIDKVYEKLNGKNILAIGAAMQGRVNSEKGISETIGIDGWKDVCISDILKERYHVPAFINHDPECILTANVSANKKDTVLLRIDSGIGMAVMKNGKLISGPGMMEIGRCMAPDGQCIWEAFSKNKNFLRNMAFAISNILTLFEIKNLVICGGYIESHESFAEELKKAIEDLIKNEIDVSVFDVKNAAYGAALYATEEYLYYLK